MSLLPLTERKFIANEKVNNRSVKLV